MQNSRTEKVKFFEELIESMRKTMLKFTRSQVNFSDAEDVVQTVCGVAWEKIDELMISPNPRGWLMNALKFYIRRYYDQVARNQKISDMLEITEKSEALSDDAEDENSVSKVLSKLDMSVVRLREEGYTHDEIAQKLGMTHGAVRTRFSRIKDKAKEFLKNPVKT